MTHPHDIDPQGYQPCQECAGTGWIRCRRCLGDGYIAQESWDYALNRPRWTRQVCSTCYGQGGWKCSVCDGTGSIERERRFEADVPAEWTSGVSQTSEPSLYDLEKDFDKAKHKAVDELTDLMRQGQAREVASKLADKSLKTQDRLLQTFQVFVDKSYKSLRDIDAVTEEIKSIDFETPGAEEKTRELWSKLSGFEIALPEGSWLRDSLHKARSAASDMWLRSIQRKERMQQ